MTYKEKVVSSQCPIPKSEYEQVLLAHGGGGKLSNQLIEKLIIPQLGNEMLNSLHDGAVLNFGNLKLAFSTDSFVVDPIFFPGGNIGDLAVNGTINDLVCCGATPLYLSLGFIIEEGFEMDEFWKVIQSIKQASEEAGVQIVTGDTKVVEKGKGDKIFINTTGIGIIENGLDISPNNMQPGDKIILNGTIADHGIAILSKRSGLEFETSIESDTAALNGLVKDILSRSHKIRVMRDPTRGGLASTLNELAGSSQKGILLHEDHIPVKEEVKGACELLGLDPLYIANEGKIMMVVAESEAEEVLMLMKKHPLGKEASIIGEVTSTNPGMVHLRTELGSTRIVDMISGEQLPRIC